VVRSCQTALGCAELTAGEGGRLAHLMARLNAVALRPRPPRQKGDDDDSDEESGSEEESEEESSEDDGPAATVGFTADPKKAAAFGVRPPPRPPVASSAARVAYAGSFCRTPSTRRSRSFRGPSAKR
jgi:hypothetical protein